MTLLRHLRLDTVAAMDIRGGAIHVRDRGLRLRAALEGLDAVVGYGAQGLLAAVKVMCGLLVDRGVAENGVLVVELLRRHDDEN